MKKYLILLIAVALLAVMFAGCTSPAPATVAPTSPQDPIIGVWRYNDSTGYDDRYHFYSDGTWTESQYSKRDRGTNIFEGTWSAAGGNSYTKRIKYSSTWTGSNSTMIYDPIQQTVTIENSFYALNRYSGEIAAATSKDQYYASMTHEQLMSAALPVTYEKLYRNNEDWVGELVLIKGQVIQVGSNYLRVATKPLKQGKGYSGDIVYVNSKSPKIMEDDYVDIYGDVNGMKTYTTVLGAEVTVPEITAQYILYEKGD